MKKEKKTQKTIAHIIVNGIILFLIAGVIFCIFVMGYTGGYSKCVNDTNKIILENNLTKK